MEKRNLILSIFSGILLALALPKPGVSILAWAALVPLLIAISSVKPLRAILYGLIFGLVYYGIILYWMTLFGHLPWILLVLLGSAFFAIFASAASLISPKRIGAIGYLAIPAAWTVMQWARSLGTYSFPWGNLAHTQANNINIIQMASITGSWGIDFVVCLVNVILAFAILSRKPGRFFGYTATALLLVAIVCAYGNAAINNQAKQKKIKIAVIQGNVLNSLNPPPDYTDQAYNIYSRMSMAASKAKPDIIIWPETTLPTILDETIWNSHVSSLATITNSNYIIGAYDSSENPNVAETYNGAHFFDRHGTRLDTYHKVHLVPFGEFVPLREKLPFLRNYGVREIDVLAGKSHKVINSEVGKIGINICFESLFPQITRNEVKKGAEIIFVITNDEWFGRTQVARQHLMMARLRAVESGRFVARAASSGISAVIDPKGRVKNELNIFTRGTIIENAGTINKLTIYSKLGDYFAYICSLITLLSLCISFLNGRRSQKVFY